MCSSVCVCVCVCVCVFVRKKQPKLLGSDYKMLEGQ